jgi:proteasome lid subunit RPN8/RPN11
MTGISRVILTAEMYRRLVASVLARHPLKSFGYLVSDLAADQPTDFVLFQENIRNETRWCREFEARGRYFVDHPDAGFVAAPEESMRIHRLLIARGLAEVAVFHTHRRHPGSFSDVDYELHANRFDGLWHMIVSLRNPLLPQLRAYAVSSAGVQELDVCVDPE